MPGVMASSRRAARRHRHLPDGREDEPAVAGPRDAAHDERRPTTEVRELAQLPRGRGDRPQVADGSVEQGERQPSAVRRDHGLNKTARGLYLRSMESLEARAISGAGELGSSPFFSPDGESVGYFVSGALQRISIGGGTAIRICAAPVSPFGVSWEPDNTILFGQPTGIMRVPASGGTPELVIAAKAVSKLTARNCSPTGTPSSSA
jgi:hypothetical protein